MPYTHGGPETDDYFDPEGLWYHVAGEDDHEGDPSLPLAALLLFVGIAIGVIGTLLGVALAR